MGKTLLLLFSFGLPILAFGQATSTDGVSGARPSASAAPTQRLVGYMAAPDDQGSEDVQTKFINQQWSKGTVTFKNTFQKVSLPLIFDAYNNTPYFLKDGQIMEFTSPIQEFTMDLIIKDDSSTVIFRQAYPDIDKNTGETFYQVLVDGNFQLLKCRAKTIYLQKDKSPEEERVPSKELFYAYLPNKKMVFIKKNKEHILSQMPEYATAINEILDSKRIKLKNADGLAKLFYYLNNGQ